MTLLTMIQFVEKNKERKSWPDSINIVRQLHHKRKEKGIEEAFVKFGKRVLVDEDKFYELIKGE